MAVNYAQQLGLGKFDPTGRMQRGQKHAQDIAYNNQTMDIRQLQQQQMQSQADKQQVVDNNIGGAIDGDVNAIRELWGANPAVAKVMRDMENQRVATMGAERAGLVNKKTTNALIQLRDTPPDQRQPLLDQMKVDDDVDFDDDAQQALAAQGNEVINLALYGLMGDKAYEAMQGNASRKFAPQVSTPQVDPETGQMFIIESDKNTGKTRRVDVDGATQRTGQQKRENEINHTVNVETAKGKVARFNKMKEEMGTRNRQAASSRRTIAEGLKLVANADQGLTGAAKMQLGRLFPMIDTSDEAALDSTLSRLSLEQLQSFKGPTTDFEYGVTQSIVGRLSDPKEANKARLKSLQRAGWFAEKEYEQFNSFVKGGGDPDNFKFDFNEKTKVGNKEFSLQQIQDTAVHYNLSIEEVMGKLNAANN